jgi:hypothetical protein
VAVRRGLRGDLAHALFPAGGVGALEPAAPRADGAVDLTKGLSTATAASNALVSAALSRGVFLRSLAHCRA